MRTEIGGSEQLVRERGALEVILVYAPSCPKGPRTQIIGFQGPNTMILMVFGP